MSNEDKYLDYEGLGIFTNELENRLADLEYDPERMFANMRELLTRSKWGADRYGRVAGLKKGLIVTIGGKIWQLEDTDTFGTILRRVQPINEKLIEFDTPDKLGWKLVGSDVNFNVDDHILKLEKK